MFLYQISMNNKHILFHFFLSFLNSIYRDWVVGSLLHFSLFYVFLFASAFTHAISKGSDSCPSSAHFHPTVRPSSLLFFLLDSLFLTQPPALPAHSILFLILNQCRSFSIRFFLFFFFFLYIQNHTTISPLFSQFSLNNCFLFFIPFWR